jgi:hypothetical protein
VRRALALVAAAVALVAAAAAPAGAHSGSNASRSLRSVLVTAPDGLTVTVAADGSSVTLAATRPTVVLGYSGEPFLRLAGGTVFENGNSLTTYDARDGVLDTIPASAGTGPVAWRSVGAERSHSWPDHRILFSGSELPAAVMDDPGSSHVVTRWSIPVVVDGTRTAIEGRVDWVPASDSAVLTVLLPVGFLVLAVGVAAWAAFPRRRVSAGT